MADGSSIASAQAQSNPGGGSVGNGAQFRRVPMATPAAPTTVYAPYVGPYAGYWSGQAGHRHEHARPSTRQPPEGAGPSGQGRHAPQASGSIPLRTRRDADPGR